MHSYMHSYNVKTRREPNDFHGGKTNMVCPQILLVPEGELRQVLVGLGISTNIL